MRRKAIATFFDTFHHDWASFRALWTADPVMAMPFAPPGFSKVYAGAEAFDGFWRPVFEIMTGHFDWTVHRVTELPGSDEFLVLSSSEVDTMLGDKPLRYQGDYVQIFRFDGERIAQLTEYFDSHKMALAYGTASRAP